MILMDEPCSALDPIATARIEDLMQELVADYTIVIVTHNMQQAARVSDRTAFFTVECDDDGHRTGHARRVRPDRDDLHEPQRRADRGLRDGAVRMTPRSASTRSSSAIELELLAHGGARRAARCAAGRRAGAARRGARAGGDRRRRRDRRALPEDRLGRSALLALQSPVAADLRLVSAILHSNLHLERIGDQAVNIAKIYLSRRSELPGERVDASQIQEMGDIVVPMIRTAMEAFAQARPGARACSCRRWTTRSTG